MGEVATQQAHTGRGGSCTQRGDKCGLGGARVAPLEALRPPSPAAGWGLEERTLRAREAREGHAIAARSDLTALP